MGGCASLLTVVRSGTADALRSSCARIRDIDATESVEGLQRWSALQFAAWLGKEDCVQVLIDFGAGLELADANGSTSLHLASSRGHVDAARVLLDAGARINSTDRNGMTPLHNAAMEGYDDVVKLLCRRQAEVNYPDQDGATPLHLASYEGHLIVVYILLESGAAVRIVDNRGNTPLHDAAFTGHETIMHRLLRSGADLGYRNQNGMTAEEIFEITRSQPAMALDVEDSQSTVNGSDTMPATPPRQNPSLAASSSIDASLPGSGDDDSMDEVTSPYDDRSCMTPPSEPLRRMAIALGAGPSRVDPENQPPTRENPFGGLEPSPEM